MQFSGGLFEMAASAAQMTGSYLFTDLKAKWAQIEQQRGTTGDTQVWSPFAKALQNTKLHYLDNLELHHALQLRAEGRLENLRSFMTKMWQKHGATSHSANEQPSVSLELSILIIVNCHVTFHVNSQLLLPLKFL